MNKSYKDKPEETGVEAEEMETIEREEAAVEVERQDGKAQAQEVQGSADSMFRSISYNLTKIIRPKPENEEMEASAPETKVNNIVFIRGKHQNITSINPGRVKQRIEELAGEVEQIIKSRDCLKVTCKSTQSKRRLMEAETLHGYDVIISEPFAYQARSQARHQARTARSNRGIIFGVDKDITNEEMTASIGLPAERIVKQKGENTIVTEQMIIHFTDKIPPCILNGWKRYKARVYVPEQTRCYKCQE